MLDKVVIETKSDEAEGNLPYYKLEDVVLDGEVAVAEVSKSEDGKTVVYKAVATYTQKAVPVNLEGGEELEFTYVVEYLGKVSIRLVSVDYEQGVIWEDAHDNIYTNSQCVVTRRATYSDGEVVETKFYSTKNFVQSVTSLDEKDFSGGIEYTNYTRIKTVDSTVATCATGVPDLEHFNYVVGVDENSYVNWNDYQSDSIYIEMSAYKGPVGIWTEYKHQDTKELYSESEQIEGCYGKQFGYRSTIVCRYRGDVNYGLRMYNIDLIYKDRFFCIDGKLFTYKPLEHTHKWSVETIETPNRGTCALHKLESNVTWLGRNLYYAVVDTVYVKQPPVAATAAAPAALTSSRPALASTCSSSASSRPARSGISSRSGSPYVDAPEYRQVESGGMSLSVGTVPGSVPYTEHTIIRPDGTRTTIRREGIVSDLPSL